MSKRPKLTTIDEEMRRWCAMLEEELSSWPAVSMKPMFGMVAFYHGTRIFAAVPRTRAADTPRSILIKLPRAQDERLRRTSGPGAAWVTFELESEDDLADALRRLGRAYERAHAQRPG
jgi:hypothetical protein